MIVISPFAALRESRDELCSELVFVTCASFSGADS